MTRSNLKVEVQGSYILVAMRGTCLRVKCRKQEAPWLATEEYGPDDPEATITPSEFRALAWTAANDAARQLGWISGYDELHESVKYANPS
jgi:hypothetical protein